MRRGNEDKEGRIGESCGKGKEGRRGWEGKVRTGGPERVAGGNKEGQGEGLKGIQCHRHNE